jgi:hypothetical protein
VSRAVARSGKTLWHPYCSRTLINATNAEPRISWLLPSSTSRGRARIPALSIRERPNPTRRRRSLRLSHGDISDRSLSGGR